jgi:serine/threonine-protein kinase
MVRDDPGDTSDPLIGAIIANTRLEQFVARGGMARVYRAQHLVLDRQYAVKVQLDPGATLAQGRFVREAKIASALVHPNVVVIHDFGVTADGLLYLVMEWIDGAPLSRVLERDAPLAPARAAHIVRGIAAALQAIHERGFVHRDLKPSNVMLAHTAEPPGERAKLLDFGLARSTEAAAALTHAGQIVGTPHYIAPEVMAGRAPADARSDLYALGVVLYSMLSGYRPYAGRTPAEILRAQLHDMPVAPPLAGGLEALAMAMIQPDPQARPQTAAEVMGVVDRLGLPAWNTPSHALVPPAPATTAPYPLRDVARDQDPTGGERGPPDDPTAPGGDPTALGPRPLSADDHLSPTAVPTVVVESATRSAPTTLHPHVPSLVSPAPPLPTTPPPSAHRPRRTSRLALVGAGVALMTGTATAVVVLRALTAAPAPVPTAPPLRAHTAETAPPAVGVVAVRAPPEATPARAPVPAARPTVEPTTASPAERSAKPSTPRARAPEATRAEAPPRTEPSPRAALDAELRARRWSAADLHALPPLMPLVTALAAAEAAAEVEAITRAAAALLAELDGADPEGRRLKAHLDAIGATLTARSATMPVLTLNELESRYFDLAQRPRAGLTPGAYRERTHQIAALAREVQATAPR